jgi:glycosyltransferase involved in cell wall biosynthesis
MELAKREDIQLYVQEMPYFRKDWENAKKLVYGKDRNKVIQNITKWDGQDIDVVYSITFPYNIVPFVHKDNVIPKCVFYTSEFASLDRTYFTCDFEKAFVDMEAIKGTVNHDRNRLFFTAPSKWSARGMKLANVPEEKNAVIPHGVDGGIFKKCSLETRAKIRAFYKVKESDILLVNIGAMTGNKGIALIISALHQIVNIVGKKQYKILFKGTGDLYTSKGFLEQTLNSLTNIKKEHMDNLLTNHIIFTDKTLSYDRINELFSAADLYVSPYLAEGFNLVVLEALTAGLPILVPTTGSTKEFIGDIYKNGGQNFIHYVESNVFQKQDSRQNIISIEELVRSLLWFKKEGVAGYDKMREYILQEYSWENVVRKLVEYLKKCSF